ncbi:ubiquinone biosynthesis protein UbiA [Halobacteriales archaeon QS_1_68_20]|nr:MAG: ubiquinone biosynthesis protein UbiA [Halobacteriales archaeon QS_1_68_20]
MAVARHGDGRAAVLRALASQVHPVFMLPPIAASVFGGLVAGTFSTVAAGVHAVAIFAAVYTAHVKDGYVDFHRRGEDDDHPLTARGCRLALVAATALHVTALVGLWVIAGWGAVALTAPTWLIAYHHAPQLDTNPIGATTGYPAGIALSVLGGFYVQAGTLAVEPVGFAAVFLVLLTGVKVIDDAQDYDYDRSIEKRTVAVVLGPARARRVAFGLMVAALALVGVLAALPVFPASAALAVVPFGAVAYVARRADPELATMLLVRGAYLFLAVLVAAVWARPIS